MLQKTIQVMECSRIFSLPMSVLSWLAIFVYALIDSGNPWYGILALIGIGLVHLGTNLIDDYFDYKSLIKQVDFDKAEYLKNSQKTKCRYLINGVMKESDILLLSGGYFLAALLIGVFLFFKCGSGIMYFVFAGAVIALIYPFISRICLSEIAVAAAYGPTLFGGVYYVMTGTYSKEIFLFSMPTMFMTVVLLYIHTVMDFEYDRNEGKRTIANSFDSPLDSLIVLKILLILAYISPVFLCIFDIVDWQIFLVYLTIPLAVDLYKSMIEYTTNPNSLPERKWYHIPMENFEKLVEHGEAGFMMRMYQSRNLMIYFTLFFTIGIILSLAI